MARVVRVVPALGALGVALVLIGGLTAVSSALAASTAPGPGPSNVLGQPDPTAEGTADATQSPASTRSPQASRTADITKTVEVTPSVVPTDTPVPTSTNTATNTATSTRPASTHTPAPSSTVGSNTSTPDNATEPAGSPSPQSTVLGIEQAATGIVLPTTGSGTTAGSWAAGMIAGVAMMVGGLTLLLIAAERRKQRS